MEAKAIYIYNILGTTVTLAKYGQRLDKRFETGIDRLPKSRFRNRIDPTDRPLADAMVRFVNACRVSYLINQSLIKYLISILSLLNE